MSGNIKIFRGGNQLTTRRRAILERLRVPHIINKFQEFYWTQRFITVFTTAHKLPYPEPVHASPSYLWTIHLISTPHLHLGLPSGPFPSGFPNTLYEPPLPTTHTKLPAYLILLDLITRIVFGKEYRSLSSPLRSLLHSTVPSTLLGLNSFLSTLFSNILSLGSLLTVSVQLSYPHEKTGKIIVLIDLIFTFFSTSIAVTSVKTI